MKKALLPLVLLILLSFPVSAASGRLSADTVSGKVGGQVTVAVHLDNPGIVATRIFVRYDSAVLQLDSAENGEVFSQSCAVFGKDIHANPYTMLWDDSLRTKNITTDGTLCTLRFTIRSAASGGETDIRIAVDKGSTFDVYLREVTVADTTCTVKTGGAPAVTVSGAASAPTDATLPTSSTAAAKTAATGKPITAATGGVSRTAAPSTAAAESKSAPSAASAESVPDEPAGTTAAQTVPDIGTTATAEETESDSIQAAAQSEKDAASASAETDGASGILTIGATEEPAARRVNLLWLLVLVPVAAVLLFAIFKKKQ